MRLLFIGHYFQPEPNFFYGLPFAKELVRRGHEVQVITGFPNYPGGKIYAGYKIKPLQKEVMDGVPVYRFPLYPSHDSSAFGRMLCYSSLALSQGLMAPFVIKPADVAYVDQGPATMGFPATILKWLRRIPFVLIVQDLWPDSVTSSGMFESKIGEKILHGWSNFVHRRASKLVIIAPGMKKVLMERGVPEEKIELIYNWCDNSLISRVGPDKNLIDQLGFTGKFNVVYGGNMGKAQSLGAVIEAASLLQNDYPLIQFVFIGSGVDVEYLKSMVANKKLTNVLFLPHKPVSQIGPILRQADVLLVHLRKDPLFAITIPSKTQAYLALGKPVLIAVEGDAADLVTKAEAGFACNPEDPKMLAQTVIRFYQMSPQQREQMGKNGAAFYDKELAFNVAVDKYLNVFQSVAGHK